jgi:hypothetical protein
VAAHPEMLTSTSTSPKSSYHGSPCTLHLASALVQQDSVPARVGFVVESDLDCVKNRGVGYICESLYTWLD